MKLDEIGLILEATDLSLFNKTYLKQYKDLFILGLSWLAECEPGSAAVDIRTGTNPAGSGKDIRFFMSDSKNPASAEILGYQNRDKVFCLDDNVYDKKVYFVIKDLRSIVTNYDCRLSLDWISPGRLKDANKKPELIIDTMLKESRLPFIRKDRFYMIPKKRNKP